MTLKGPVVPLQGVCAGRYVSNLPSCGANKAIEGVSRGKEKRSSYTYRAAHHSEPLGIVSQEPGRMHMADGKRVFALACFQMLSLVN